MIFEFEHGTLPGSLELAYLGDALYDLFVREHLVAHGGRVRRLHREAIHLVCAHAQAEALGRVEPALTEAEAAVGRATPTSTRPATPTPGNTTAPPPWRRWWGGCTSPARGTG